MTSKEKTAKLDATIQKRLGIKAKALWNNLKSDLSFAFLTNGNSPKGKYIVEMKESGFEVSKMEEHNND